MRSDCFRSLLSVFLVTAVAGVTLAQGPSAQQALRLRPIQKDADYDRPTDEVAEQCVIRPEKIAGRTGWVVRSAAGQILRSFADTNGDNVVDRWSYYKDGLEVYRDIDANFNGKADQYRWFNTGGTRWGIDKDENGTIDAWKMISPEEVAAEVVAALRTRDAKRFELLLLTEQELKDAGLGETQAKDVAAKIKAAPSAFSTLAVRQKSVGRDTEFVSFGGTRPGIVPAGSDGSTKDVMVYENVAAMTDSEGKHSQVMIGTMIRAGDLWRLIDVPHVEGGERIAAGGYFFRASLSARPDQTAAATSEVNEEMQKVMADLEQIDRAIAQAGGSEQQKLNNQRADLLERLANEAADKEQRGLWLRQLADTVSAAVQTGTFAEGMARLKKLEDRLAKEKESDELLAYVAFRRLTAGYSHALQDPKADFAKIQEKWIGDLESFVKAHPQSADAAEAMLQLAIAQEFAGEDEMATEWYGRIVNDFSDSAPAKKAAGAKRRLESVGKSIPLSATTIDGKSLNLASYKGKVVLIQYWATWCEPCKADMEEINDLYAKYHSRGFEVVGVSLDGEKAEAEDFLKKNRLPWPQVYEPGGLENRLANEMGILTLPTMLLIGADGNVISRNIHAGELDKELRAALK